MCEVHVCACAGVRPVCAHAMIRARHHISSSVTRLFMVLSLDLFLNTKLVS